MSSKSPAFPPPPAPLTPVAPTPFALTPSRDDTALFQDSRACFSHLLPGRPVLGFPPLRPDEPPADILVHLQDAPITIRYRLEPPSFTAPNASELARGSAERYASWRANASVVAEFANATWLTSWSVEAAAVASYDLPNGHHDELFVLVKQGLVLYVSWTYPQGFAADPAYAAFASVAEATMIWDTARWEQRGRVWPESAFLAQGLHGAPRPKHYEAAKRLRHAPITPEERAHLMAILAGVVSAAGAPWVVLAPAIREAHRRAIFGAAREPSLRAFVEAAFGDIRTAHDLRGLAVLIGRALDGTLATSSFPPPPGAAVAIRLPPPPRIVG